MNVVGNEICVVVAVTGVVIFVVRRGLDVDAGTVVISLSTLVVEIGGIAIVVTGVFIEVDVEDCLVTVEAVEVPKEL